MDKKLNRNRWTDISNGFAYCLNRKYVTKGHRSLKELITYQQIMQVKE